MDPTWGVVAIGLALLSAGPCRAQEIYRWVDENGVVNFSDTAPADQPASQVGRVVVEDTRPSDFDPEEDRYDVAGQAERLQALRRERAEQRQARRVSEVSAPAPESRTSEPAYAWPPWWSRPAYGRPPYRPPRPERPIEPPAQPPTSTLKPPPWIDG